MTSLKTSIKTITYLSDIGCLEIQGASLHVAECILGKTASLAPRFKHHAKAFAVLQIRLDLPTDSGEVAAM